MRTVVKINWALASASQTKQYILFCLPFLGHDMSKAVIIPECGAKDIGGLKDEISISPTEKKDGAIGLFSRLLRFDSLKRNSAPESPTATEPPTTYYGVYIPCEIKKGPDEGKLLNSLFLYLKPS